MASRTGTMERWSAEATLATGDASKTLLAAKTGRSIVVTFYRARILVAAAQAVDIKVGTVVACKFAASEAVGTESFIGPMDYGLVGQVSTALTITPAAAGPSMHVVAEGYYQ